MDVVTNREIVLRIGSSFLWWALRPFPTGFLRWAADLGTASVNNTLPSQASRSTAWETGRRVCVAWASHAWRRLAAREAQPGAPKPRQARCPAARLVQVRS